MRSLGFTTLWGVLALVLFATPAAQAHFLWLVTEPAEQPTAAKIFFGEAPEADDPDLLDRVMGAEVWGGMGGFRAKPEQIKFHKGDEALEAEIPEKLRSGSLVLKHTYGVVNRPRAGQEAEPFLLNYYAKSYPSSLPGTWEALDDKERLPLEITPMLHGSEMTFDVRWQGQPVADSTVTVNGPGLDKPVEGTTDAKGRFRCQISQPGLYAIRARMIENTPGEHDGKKYNTVRSYTTLALPVSLAKVSPAAHSWPELPQGMTSFGGAVIDDFLYVYGGNYGPAHQVSQAGQSGDLHRLNLKNPQKWEPLAGSKKLTGLAMVAHDGKLYRIGGFNAKNKTEDDEQDLWSQPDFARFDPAQGQWESLPPLPEGRSSHDAAILGDTLYVVGGWTLKGAGESVWHDTAWSMDLSKPDLAWKAIAPPPFQRRALTLAAWNDQLYVIGGMQPNSKTTTAVAVYNPAENKWSEGPALLGMPMDGFGASAFASSGSLYVTTMSGSVQRLAADGKAWELVGQLEHPRFFHRLLPWGTHDMVVVGGGHMSVGKIQPLERLPLTAK